MAMQQRQECMWSAERKQNFKCNFQLLDLRSNQEEDTAGWAGREAGGALLCTALRSAYGLVRCRRRGVGCWSASGTLTSSAG